MNVLLRNTITRPHIKVCLSYSSPLLQPSRNALPQPSTTVFSSLLAHLQPTTLIRTYQHVPQRLAYFHPNLPPRALPPHLSAQPLTLPPPQNRPHHRRATRGIGAAIAHSLAAAGANIFLLGRSTPGLSAVAASISAAHPDAAVASHAADITSAAAVHATFDAARACFGPVDVLISNAGYLDAHETVSASALDDFWACFEVNVRGGLVVAQEWLKDAPRGGTLINISSGAAHVVYIPGYAAYAASKMAMARVVEFLGEEGRSRGIRCFNLSLGVIETDMAKKAGDVVPKDDIELPGAFCVWLASPEADFLSGRIVWVNWDVDELLARKEAIEKGDLLRTGLKGWPAEVE